MKKEFTILLVGMVTGAGIMHLLDTDPVRVVQLDMANSEQLAMTSTAVVGNSKRDENAPTREKTDRAAHTYPDNEDFTVQPQGKSDRATLAIQADPYQATALQLAKIADNAQWAQSFQGNYSAEADAANTQLTQLADNLTRQFGSYYASGCNQQFCAMLAQGFADRQQAEAAIEQMLGSKQLPNFKYYRIVEDETGIALRFSIPIDQNFVPTTADLTAFSQKFKSLSP